MVPVDSFERYRLPVQKQVQNVQAVSTEGRSRRKPVADKSFKACASAAGKQSVSATSPGVTAQFAIAAAAGRHRVSFTFAHVAIISTFDSSKQSSLQAAKKAKPLLRQNFINPKSHVTLARLMVNSSLSSRGPTLTSTAS
jgi:proline racemase